MTSAVLSDSLKRLLDFKYITQLSLASAAQAALEVCTLDLSAVPKFEQDCLKALMNSGCFCDRVGIGGQRQQQSVFVCFELLATLSSVLYPSITAILLEAQFNSDARFRTIGPICVKLLPYKTSKMPCWR